MLNCIIYLNAPTSQEEILLGNPRDFNVFHKFLGLTIYLLIFFSKSNPFFLKIIFLTLYLAVL